VQRPPLLRDLLPGHAYIPSRPRSVRARSMT
jgi:hypothetical protein